MGFESSVSDLDLALVFAEIAACSDCPVTRSRNLVNACNMYSELRDEPCAYPVGNWQRVEIEARLHKLRSCLEFLGESFVLPSGPSGVAHSTTIQKPRRHRGAIQNERPSAGGRWMRPS